MDGHTHEECVHPTQCTNCLGPVPAWHPTCPIKPRRSFGKTVPATKQQRAAARAAGAALFRETREAALHTLTVTARSEEPTLPSSSPPGPQSTLCPRPRDGGVPRDGNGDDARKKRRIVLRLPDAPNVDVSRA